ncbi:hypothetical protein L1049_018217 [Liquidambar formosana]|uniref:Uncharacterized protein n=1 Tax=Liquidambar formosana TaxID=63359 RepID=A0AAP0R9T2_LIQFO
MVVKSDKGKRPLSNAQSNSQSQSQSHGEGKSRSYVVWTTEMDIALASVLYDQVNQGNKGDEIGSHKLTKRLWMS